MSRAACGGEETRWGRGRGAGLTKKVKPGEGGGEERDGGWIQLPRNSIAPPGARDPDPRATRSSGIPTRFESPRDKRSGVQRLTPKSSHPCSHWPLDRAGEGGQSLCQPHPTCPRPSPKQAARGGGDSDSPHCSGAQRPEPGPGPGPGSSGWAGGPPGLLSRLHQLRLSSAAWTLPRGAVTWAVTLQDQRALQPPLPALPTWPSRWGHLLLPCGAASGESPTSLVPGPSAPECGAPWVGSAPALRSVRAVGSVGRGRHRTQGAPAPPVPGSAGMRGAGRGGRAERDPDS